MGLVVVSHSAALAEGVVELAREMGGEEVKIEAAGGWTTARWAPTPPASTPRSSERCRTTGVLVLMDLAAR